MIDLDIVQRLYFKAEELCSDAKQNGAWLFERKFAELIVEECGYALRPMLRDQISRGQAHDLIKEHFGVE